MDSFDPLMSAYFSIMIMGVKFGGPEILEPNNDGTLKCPICYLECPQWIQFAANGVKEVVDKLRDEEFPEVID